MVNKLRRFLFLCVTAYGVVLVVMFALQRDLMYHPDPTPPNAPPHYGFTTAKQMTLKTEDEITLLCWYVPPKEGMPLMIYFHGNAGNLSDRYRKLGDFTAQGMGLLAVSYRGFGGSSGHPTERGLYADGRAALQYAMEIKKISADKIILYGESLGTGVAVQLATESPVGLVVLESPYTSTVDRGAEMYPFLPVSLLMQDRFESIEKIAAIHAPLLIFHNTGDAVIPIAHGRALYAAAKAPKRAIWFKHQGHTDFDWKRLEREIREYYSAKKAFIPKAS